MRGPKRLADEAHRARHSAGVRAKPKYWIALLVSGVVATMFVLTMLSFRV